MLNEQELHEKAKRNEFDKQNQHKVKEEMEQDVFKIHERLEAAK